MCSQILTPSTLIKLEVEIPEAIKRKTVGELTWEEIPLYAKWKGFKPGWVWFQRNQLKTMRAMSRYKK